MSLESEKIEADVRAAIAESAGVSGPEPALPAEIDDYTMVPYAEKFAVWAHGDQKYGDHPYPVHLREVVQILDDHGFDVHYHPLVVITGWLHDVVEDTFVTLTMIANRFGDAVTEMVDACTGEGMNRKARQKSIHDKLLKCPEAQPAKGADRLANMRSSLREKKRGLVQMYSKEFDSFMQSVPFIPESMKAALNEVQAQSLAYLKEAHA